VRILTLWQPWATLVALDEKAIETRGWGTSYRGSFVIHAAQKFDAVSREWCTRDPFRFVLRTHGILEPEQLPLGAIVCVTKLVDCIPTDGLEALGRILAGGRFEKNFGDYRPGRRAWILQRPPIRLEPPIPFKNGQGLRAMPGALAGELAQRLIASSGAPHA